MEERKVFVYDPDKQYDYEQMEKQINKLKEAVDDLLECLENGSFNNIMEKETFMKFMNIKSENTFYDWQRKGLKVCHIGRKQYIFYDDLRNFLEKHKI